MTEPTPHPNRRTILKTGLAAAAALAPRPMLAESITAADHSDAAPSRSANAATMRGARFDRRDTVRFAIVGTGLRGRSIISELLSAYLAELGTTSHSCTCRSIGKNPGASRTSSSLAARS